MNMIHESNTLVFRIVIEFSFDFKEIYFTMELDLKSFFGLHVHCCAHWLRPRNPPPSLPRILAHIRGHYWSAR
jgi:hypothetical protein